MFSPPTRDSLQDDTNTVIAVLRRNSAALHGVNMRRQIARAGIERSMFCAVEKCWLIPLSDLLAFIRQAEADHRVVLIEDQRLGGVA